ncbi:MAG TPA: hypothetical protein VGI79_13790 [Caulobacteraceae bacterium]|jgi:hypothetical protein
MKKLLLLAIVALSLAACETTPTVYGPAAGPLGVGYSESPIEQGRWRVTFRGGPGADARRVGDLTLLRAADLTLREGYDWFRVTDRYTSDSGETSEPRVSLGVGGANFGRGSAVGVGGGVGFNLGGGSSITGTIEILMGKGPAPHDPDVYDARQIRSTVGQRT